jgi:hypothetical protein
MLVENVELVQVNLMKSKIYYGTKSIQFRREHRKDFENLNEMLRQAIFRP